MKNIFRYLTVAAAVAAFASCDGLNETPVFDEADSFVAIDQSSITVDENTGVVSIPVTVASIDPVQTVVTYAVKDSTAVAGVNYSLVNEFATLEFDGKERTMNIEINIVDLAGEYTGDLVFSVDLVSAGSLNLGANTTCAIKISDLDHPLADVLGTYECVAKDKGAGDVSWTMTMSKDPSDVTVVWVDYVCPLAANNSSMKFAVYGIVSEDHKTIKFPCGQKPGAEYEAGDPFTFVWFDYDGGYMVEESGFVTMTSTEPGVFTTEDGMGFCSTSYVFNGGMILKGTAVWTKK